MKFPHSDFTAYRMLLHRKGMQISAKFNKSLMCLLLTSALYAGSGHQSMLYVKPKIKNAQSQRGQDQGGEAHRNS